MTEHRQPRRSSDLIFFVLAICSVFAAFAFFSWRNSDSGSKSRKGKGFRFSVRAEKAQLGEIRERLKLSGDLMAKRKVSVHLETEGVVFSLRVREGDFVRKGQMILALRSTDQRLAMQRAKALWEQAKASLQRSQAVLARDRDRFQRSKRLRRTKTISKNELIQARYQFEASRAAVAEAKAQIALRQTELGIARQDLSCTVLRAPFSGRIGRLYVEQGKWLRRGDVAVELVDSSVLEVRIYVPLRHLARVKVGQAIRVLPVFSAKKAAHVQAKLLRLLPAADATSRNRTAIAELRSPTSGFLPGVPVHVQVTLATRSDALLVRKDALLRQGNRWVLFKVEQGKARSVQVDLLYEERGFAEVSGALKPGEQVVVSGNEALFHNAPVLLSESGTPQEKQKMSN
ncbi:MAG: efflux RND transporter periplasmic adaptor subunit [Myxococcota bacterium]